MTALVALALAACSAGTQAPTVTVTVVPTAPIVPTVAPIRDSSVAMPPVVTTAAVRDLEGLLAELPGESGVAIVRAGEPAVVVGNLTTGVAWSTAKVPVGIAALALSDTAVNRRLVTRAITRSDNEAAEALWAGLGAPKDAAALSTAVLRMGGGDQTTVVSSVRTLAGFSAYGQTEWALGDAAGFAARLPCLPGAEQVYALMGRIIDEQRWGLGRVAGTHFKGGWGPVANHYLVRQLGVLTLVDGTQVGVAIITMASTLTEGQKSLSKIADWLGARLGDISGGICRIG